MNRIVISLVLLLIICRYGCVDSFVPTSSRITIDQQRLYHRRRYHPITKSRQNNSHNNNNNNHHLGTIKASTNILYSAASSSSGSDDSDARRLKKMKRSISKEFFSIGFPAFVQLTAEPLASLVDTAYLGRLGPEVLGGAGVAITAQYAVSKLYNDPLLRTSVSLVATLDGKNRAAAAAKNNDDVTQTAEMAAAEYEKNQKELSVSVSSALLLALVVGVVQAIVYTVFVNGITQGMGLTPSSPMWYSAVSYLRVRALGTPAATLWLVTNGIFRGLGNTNTPLKYSLCFALLNAILDPIFIFTLGFGASGAAAGTAIAQYVALIPLLVALNKRVKIDMINQIRDLGASLKEYLKAGTLVLFRTLAKVFAYSICAREAALLGSVSAAAYNLTFQLGFATTQICEAVAVAVQTLLARELAVSNEENDAKEEGEGGRKNLLQQQKLRHTINLSILLGGGIAAVLSLTTFLQRTSILQGLTTNVAVQQAASQIFPAVLVTQALKGLAYPVNGILMGGLDWFFAMIAMWIANVVCVSIIKVNAATTTMTLARIWWALAAFMGTQVVAGIFRYEITKTGIWKILRKDNNKGGGKAIKV